MFLKKFAPRPKKSRMSIAPARRWLELLVGIGIAPLELVTCSHVFSPQLPLNQTCKLSSPNRLCALRRFRASKTLQSVGFRGPLRQWGVFDCKDASDQIAGTVLPPPPPPPPPPRRVRRHHAACQPRLNRATLNSMRIPL